MVRFLSVVAGGLAALLVLATPLDTCAQQPSDSIRAEAMRDFHGPDMEGKDGPLAKAGPDLLVLYHEYRAFQRQGGGAFTPTQSGIRVSDGHVTIDAIAAAEVKQLRSDLKALGLKEGGPAGRVVSGKFPIGRIPKLAKLESLRGVVPSQMKTMPSQRKTHDQGTAPQSQPGTTLSESDESTSSESARTAEDTSVGLRGILIYVGGALLIGALLVLLLYRL